MTKICDNDTKILEEFDYIVEEEIDMYLASQKYLFDEPQIDPSDLINDDNE
jgi:hypothetical protein